MNSLLQKTMLVVLAIVCSVTTVWSQPPPTTVYVSDTGFGGILKFDAAGQMTIFASGIGNPTGLAFDNSGNLYVSNWNIGRIEKYNPSGGMSVFTSGDYLCQPRGLAFDGNGVLYVTNACSNTIIKCDSTGQQTVFASGSPLNVPFGLAFDRNGNLYAASTNGNAVYKFDTSGNATLFANTGGYAPSALAFDSNGNLYVGTLQNNSIQKFDSAGQGTLFATTNGYPYGIAFDTAGYLYVATSQNTIERFDSAGQGTVFAPGIVSPYAIAIQPSAVQTPAPTVNISGNVTYCSNPLPVPVPDVMIAVTGDNAVFTLSNGSGNYMLSLAIDGSYDVTPSKTALAPGSAGINTVDVIAVQRHFLNITPLPPGCPREAADVNADTAINTADVIAIQRFALGRPSGTAQAGRYQFMPVIRSYIKLSTSHTAQDFDALIFGDVAGPFAE